jgi:hypothetical protein
MVERRHCVHNHAWLPRLSADDWLAGAHPHSAHLVELHPAIYPGNAILEWSWWTWDSQRQFADTEHIRVLLSEHDHSRRWKCNLHRNTGQ